MSKRGENIFKRKDGRWEARYEKARNAQGRIIYGFCYGRTYKEAKDKVRKAKMDILLGNVCECQSKEQFCRFLDEWLVKKRNTIKTSSYAKYETIVEKHIKPLLGDRMISTLDQSIDQTISEHCSQLGLSAKMQKDIVSILRAVLVYVKDTEPAFRANIQIGFSHVRGEEPRVLSVNEFKRLMEYLLTDMDCCKFGIALAAMTGMRIGEICALKWYNVSLTERLIKIDSTMQRVKDYSESGNKTQIMIGPPKSCKSVRTIPITDFCFELCSKMMVANNNAYVLTGTEAFIEPRLLQYRMKTLTTELGLDDVHFHTLRHTFATMLNSAGVDIARISAELGHSNISTTLNKYTHVFGGATASSRGIADAMDAKYSKTAPILPLSENKKTAEA